MVLYKLGEERNEASTQRVVKRTNDNYLRIKYSFFSAGRRSILLLCTRLENRNEKGFNRLHHKTIDRCWEIEARAEYLKLRYLNPSVKEMRAYVQSIKQFAFRFRGRKSLVRQRPVHSRASYIQVKSSRQRAGRNPKQ